MVTSATLPSSALASRSLKVTCVSCTAPIFLPTKVHRQTTPVIRNTQITSCLTVEFNRVSSFFRREAPGCSGASVRPSTWQAGACAPEPALTLDAPMDCRVPGLRQELPSRPGVGPRQIERFYSERAEQCRETVTNARETTTGLSQFDYFAVFSTLRVTTSQRSPRFAKARTKRSQWFAVLRALWRRFAEEAKLARGALGAQLARQVEAGAGARGGRA